MAIHWLEQTEVDVPADNQWLGTEELRRLDTLRFAKRRADWRLGRWTAKRAVAACLNLPGDPHALANIEILAASSGAPEVFLGSEPAPLTISLSHRDGSALCTVAPSGTHLGCDLELIEPRSHAFLADYFTDHEQALIQQSPIAERDFYTALFWSAKESTLKALHVGLRLDTRDMAVSLANPSPTDDQKWGRHPRPVPPLPDQLNDWSHLQVVSREDQVFCGWWRRADHMVRSIVFTDVPQPQGLLQDDQPSFHSNQTSPR